MDLTSFLMGRITGGGSTPLSTGDKPVKFIDYDGTIVYSYTPEEFLALDAMPENPQHEGLISEGWNYTFEEAKSQVETVGDLVAGQTYITDNGATRFYVQIDVKNSSVNLAFTQQTVGIVVIDWGDDSPTETISSQVVNISHTYSNVGEHCISIDPQNGSVLGFASTESEKTEPAFRAYLTRVELGKNVVLGMYAFNYCKRLTTITMSNKIQITFYDSLFNRDPSLVSLTIPNLGGTLDLSNKGLCYECYSLTSVSLPINLIGTGNSFQTCYSLTTISIPKNVTVLGYQCFNNCNLVNIYMPPSIQLNASVFMSCHNLQNVYNSKNITFKGDQVFNHCESLTKFIMSDTITSISTSMFTDCYKLREIKLSNTLTIIPSGMFSYCYSLKSIIFPSTITTIESAFSWCTNLLKLDFSNLIAVPSLKNSSVFSSLPSIAKIIVPDALYDDWIAATNWSTYANKIVKASEVQ